MRSDYRQLGMPYDPPPERIDRLVEALRLTKRLIAGETVTHAGPHYPLRAARLAPLPAVAPRILIGGGGRRMLSIAAREADTVGLLAQFSRSGRSMLWQGTEAATAAKVAIVREAAGERFPHLELNVLVVDCGLVGGATSLGRSAATLAKSIAPAAVGGSPYVLYRHPRAAPRPAAPPSRAARDQLLRLVSAPRRGDGAARRGARRAVRPRCHSRT